MRSLGRARHLNILRGLMFLLLAASTPLAAEPALLRIERAGAEDRDRLIAMGVNLVSETSTCYLAVGDPATVAERASRLGLATAVVDPEMREGTAYAIAGPRPGTDLEDLQVCGDILWFEDGWALLRAASFDREACFASPGWFLRPLTMQGLHPRRPAPAEYADLAAGAGSRLEVKPLVQDMVDSMTDTLVVDTWTALIASASTRYSTSAGCVAAATHVYDTFAALGLATEYQNHTSGHAPNVIGTLLGHTNPDNVYIVIGHLDDLPSSGSAPGADDNASGTANLVAIAKVMADYTCANTVKFIAVTGEEFGLYGSEDYAANAAAQGENILGVLDADMTAWAGDGSPAAENLDLNYNSTSAWLATLFVQTAADYGTGCPINAFLCPGMVYSDHAPFWDHGWSALCGITDNEGYCGQSGNYPYYHESADTVVNCGNPAFFASSVRAYLAATGHLADPICRRPDPPTSPAAGPAGANAISVSWTGSPTAATYQVWRSPQGCAGSAEAFYAVGETAQTSFLDSTASGGLTYGYVVESIDSSGLCVSAASACVEATTTGACLEPPWFAGVATVSNAQAPSCTLNLSWSPPLELYCGSSATYNVYRSLSSGFTPDAGNRVASGLTGTSHSDSDNLVSDTTYYYVVRAVDTANGVEDGNLVEGSGAPTGPSTIGNWSDDVEAYPTIADAVAAGWAHAAAQGVDDWRVSTSQNHTTGGARSFASDDVSTNADKFLVAPLKNLTASSVLTFWHRYVFESNYDGGVLEISTDGGTSWQDLGPSITSGGYNDTIYSWADTPLAGRDVWSGTQSSWGQVSVNLSSWAGSGRLIRWRLACDGGVAGGTWYLDDFLITNTEVPTTCTTSGCVALSCGDIVIDADPVCSGTAQQFTAVFSGGQGAISVAWDFDNDGQYDDCSTNPCTTTLPVGSNSVGLQVSDSCPTGSQQCTRATTATVQQASASPAAPGVADLDACAQSGVEITWGAAAGATGYDLRVDGTTVVSGVTSPYSYNPGDTASHSYEVRGVNVGCGAGAWSPASSGADLDQEIGTPAAPGVADLDACAQSGVEISWAPVSGADGYDLRVDGSTIVNGVTSPYTYDPGDTASHSYEVRGTSAACGAGAWSPASSGADLDEELATPAAPVAFDSFPCVQTGVRLTWDPVAGADGYDLRVDGTIVLSGVTSPYTHNPGDMLPHDYELRATSAACGDSLWSAVTSYADGTPPEDILFCDGFESGDTSAWSATVP